MRGAISAAGTLIVQAQRRQPQLAKVQPRWAGRAHNTCRAAGWPHGTITWGGFSIEPTTG